MLDKFILIGATALTLSGIVGAILMISWPDRPHEGGFKTLHLKWKIPIIIEALLLIVSIVMCVLSVVFWFKGGQTL